MKISYNTDFGHLNRNVGYGEAGYQIIQSLQRLGHQVFFNDGRPDVEIFFSQPEYWEFSRKDQYKIGYAPWESSEIPDYWLQHLGQADEVWTTSPQCQKWFEECGVDGVKVYPHGLDAIWTPQRRVVKDKLTFLHVGEPAKRKDAQLVVDIFMELFADNNEVELIIKGQNTNTTVVRNKSGDTVGSVAEVNNIKVITDDIPIDELVDLYKSAHCLVYPSWGEGFGFIPLQAMGTGMPTICTAEWAPYKNYLHDLAIDSTIQPSPWPEMHPGNMFKPDKNHLKAKMLDVYENYANYSDIFYNQAALVHEEYNWDTLTKEAFKNIVKVFG